MTAPARTSGGSLHVAVNLLWLAPGRVGGSEQYLTRQLTGLPDDRTLVPELFVQPAFMSAHPALADRFATSVLPFAHDWRAVRIAAEHAWLPRRARRADLVHHGGGTVPFTGSHPVLLTVHDLQYRQLPHYFSRGRLQYLRHMMPRSARRATMIATPSEFVRSTVIEAFAIDPDRVVVVPHGVSDHVRPSPDAQRSALARIGVVDRSVIVYPAITHPHKGHVLLIEMLRRLSDDHVLVLIGGAGTAEDDLQRAIASAGVGDRVVRAGRVSDQERDALVAAAHVLVFPSEYEGFGAPLVEAMMLGTPVVCSDQPAIREVVGGAGVVVPERTGEAWAEAVQLAARASNELAERGIARARRFSVADSGAALAVAYRRVTEVGSTGRPG